MELKQALICQGLRFHFRKQRDFWIVLYIIYYLWMEPTPLLSTERLPTHQQPALLGTL